MVESYSCSLLRSGEIVFLPFINEISESFVGFEYLRCRCRSGLAIAADRAASFTLAFFTQIYYIDATTDLNFRSYNCHFQLEFVPLKHSSAL